MTPRKFHDTEAKVFPHIGWTAVGGGRDGYFREVRRSPRRGRRWRTPAITGSGDTTPRISGAVLPLNFPAPVVSLEDKRGGRDRLGDRFKAGGRAWWFERTAPLWRPSADGVAPD